MTQPHSTFQHDEISVPFTLARQTEIQMPTLEEETIYAALFVLESDVPINVGR